MYSDIHLNIKFIIILIIFIIHPNITFSEQNQIVESTEERLIARSGSTDKGLLEKRIQELINKVEGLEYKINVLEYRFRILRSLELKVEKLDKKISALEEEQSELRPFSTSEREQTGLAGFHGYLGFGLFSPGSELNQYFGNGLIFQGYFSYFIDRFKIEPRAGISYFQKTVGTEGGVEQKIRMIPIEMAFLQDLFKRIYLGIGLHYTLVHLRPNPFLDNPEDTDTGAFGYQFLFGLRPQIHKAIRTFIEVKISGGNFTTHYYNINAGGFNVTAGIFY